MTISKRFSSCIASTRTGLEDHSHIKERNVELAMSRNSALDIAKGDYIAFIDADDYWVDNKIENQIRFILEKNCRFASSYDVISQLGRYFCTIRTPNQY